MNIDPDLWLLSIFGAGLLVAGGAALRSAILRGGTPASAVPETSPGLETSPASQDSPLSESSPVPDIRGEQPSTSAPHPANVSERELREKLAHSEVETEALRAETIDQRQRAERQSQAAQAEIRRLANELDAEKARTFETLGTLERKLEEANEERAMANAKIEALERLVEGVRARSRDLAAELSALKRS